MKGKQEETQETKESATQTTAIPHQGSASSPPLMISLFNPDWHFNGKVPVEVGEHILDYLDAKTLGLTTLRINKAWRALTEGYLQKHPAVQKEVEEERTSRKAEAKRKKEEERQARVAFQQSCGTARELFESAELKANIILSLSSTLLSPLASSTSNQENEKEVELTVSILNQTEAYLAGKENQLTFKGALQVATKLPKEEKYIAWREGFELLGDVYQQRGILQKDERQLLKAVTIYNLALCSQERYEELANKSSEKKGEVRTSCITKIKGIEELLITHYNGGVIKQTVESYWQTTEKVKRALNEIRQQALNEIQAVEENVQQVDQKQEVKEGEERTIEEAQATTKKNNDREGEKEKGHTVDIEKKDKNNKNSDLSIQVIYHHIATGIKEKVIKPLIKSCQSSLPIPEDCVYSINFLGSFARSEATPYSDFECAVLLQDQGEEKNKRHKAHMRQLITLLWIKILNLGETTARMMDITSLSWLSEQDSPVRKGFSFDGQMEDGCHTPLGNVHHTQKKIQRINANQILTEEEKAKQREKVYEGEYELIGIPRELAVFQEERWVPKRGFSTVLSTVEPIVSNDGHLEKSLTVLYEDEMEKIWDQPVEGTDKTLIQKRSLDFLAESVERFKFRGGRFDKEVHYFDAKYHLYRLPNMLLDHLASYFEVRAKNLWNKIEGLFGEKGKVANKSGAINLKVVVSMILQLRLIAYLKKGYRDDHIIMLEPAHPKKNEALLIKYIGTPQRILLLIYSVLIPLQETVKNFIEQNGFLQTLLESGFYDSSSFVQGQIYELLLEYEQAAKAYEKAKRTFIEVNGPQHVSVADTLNNLGVIYEAQGHYAKAISALKEAERIYIEIHGPQHILVAGTLHNLGIVYQVQGRYAEAIKAYDEAKRIFIAVHGPQYILVAQTLNNLAVVYEAQSHYTEAISALKEAKRIKIAVYGSQHVSVADTLHSLGAVYQAQERYAKAIWAYEEAKCIYIGVHGSQHVLVANTLNNLGLVFQVQGRYAEAIATFEEAKRIYIDVHGPHHVLVAQTLHNLGIVYGAQGRYAEAITTFEEAKRIYIDVHGPQHILVAGTLNNLGIVYKTQERYTEAIKVYEEAKSIYVEVYGPQHVSIAEILINIGNIYRAQGRYLEAIAVLEEAKRIFIVVHGPHHVLVANILHNLGLVYQAQERYAEAIKVFEEAKRIKIAVLGSQDVSVAKTLHNLGVTYQAQGRYLEAIAVLEEAKRIFIVVHEPHHVLVANTMHNLGLGYQAQGRYATAIKALEEAKSIYIAVHGSNHSLVVTVLGHLGQTYVGLKQFNQARAYYKQALMIGMSSEFSSKEEIEIKLRDSYLREGNGWMLKEPMDIEAAGMCYQQSGFTFDPAQSRTHAHLASQFYSANNLSAACEHYQIMIKLEPTNTSAYHNLACLTHVRAQIEKDKGDEEKYYTYLKEAERYFEMAIKLNAHIVIYTEYAQFMLHNRSYYSIGTIIDCLLNAIKLEQEDIGLSYGIMERLTVGPHLQSLIDEHKEITLRTYLFAYYLLIQAYLINDQIHEAKQIYGAFEAEMAQEKQAHEKSRQELINNTGAVISALPQERAQTLLQQLQSQQQAMDKEQQLLDALLIFSQQDIAACNPSVLKQQADNNNLTEEIIDTKFEAAIKLPLTSPSSELHKGESSSKEHAHISIPQFLEAEAKELKEDEDAELQKAIVFSLTKTNEEDEDKKDSAELDTPISFSSEENPLGNAALSSLVGSRTRSPLYTRSSSPPLETMKELTSQGLTQRDEKARIKREIIKHMAIIKELIEPRNSGEAIVPSFLVEVVKPQLQFSEEMLAGEYEIGQWQEQLVALKACEVILKDCQKASTSIVMMKL